MAKIEFCPKFGFSNAHNEPTKHRTDLAIASFDFSWKTGPRSMFRQKQIFWVGHISEILLNPLRMSLLRGCAYKNRSNLHKVAWRGYSEFADTPIIDCRTNQMKKNPNRTKKFLLVVEIQPLKVWGSKIGKNANLPLWKWPISNGHNSRTTVSISL
jgi:hypothetical protein